MRGSSSHLIIKAANGNREPIAMFVPPFSGIVCQRNHIAIFKAKSMAERTTNINLEFSIEQVAPKIVILSLIPYPTEFLPLPLESVRSVGRTVT